MTDGRLRRWFLLAVGAVLVAVGAGGAQGAVRSPETTDATATTHPRTWPCRSSADQANPAGTASSPSTAPTIKSSEEAEKPPDRRS